MKPDDASKDLNKNLRSIFIMKQFYALSILLLILGCSEEKDYKTLFQEAKALTLDEKYQESLEVLNKIIELNPEFDSAYAERAFCYLKLNEIDLALDDADKAVNMDRNNVKSRFVRGLIKLYWFDPVEAATDFTMVISTGDSTLYNSALYNRAKAYFFVGNIPSSMFDLNKLIAYDSLDVDAIILRGVVKSKTNLYKEYADTIQLFSNDPEKYAAFFEDYNIYTSFNTETSESYNYMYNTKAALEDFALAIEIDPKAPLAYCERSLVYFDLKKFKLALSDINLAIKLKSDDEKYYYHRSLILRELNKPDGAIEDLTKAIELNPANPYNYMNRGYIYEQDLNDSYSAELDFQKARDLGYDDNAFDE